MMKKSKHDISDISTPQSISATEASTPIEDLSHAYQRQDEDPVYKMLQKRYGDPLTYRFHRMASKTVVMFGLDDPECPVNWSAKKKAFALGTGIVQVLNSTIGSSLPSGGINNIANEFHITGQMELVLPVSAYIIGYVLGPLCFGPLSEAYGRKLPLLISFSLFIVFTLGCALANSFTSLLIFRLLCGIMGSSPIAIAGGLIADIYSDPTERGRMMAYFMASTTCGPITGPIISGFISVLGWRWTFWVGLIFSVVTLPLVVFLPETYSPIILQRRARKLRKETGNLSIVAPLELESRSFRTTLAVTLARPLRMMVYESIVSFTSLYLALAYAIFYLYIQAYPIVFEGIYKMSPGISGLCFLPIGGGISVACAIFIWYDGYLKKAKARGAQWAQIEEYRRLPLACIGGPLYVVALLWLGWTASPNIHWVAPLLSGFVFGSAYMLIFMAMLNYLSDAYETFAASAQSASTCSRSVFGAVLPLATRPMFDRLGVNWACSLIAFLSLALSAVPFVFTRYGDYIRRHSRFSQELMQLKEAERLEHERARRMLNNSRNSITLDEKTDSIHVPRLLRGNLKERLDLEK